MPGAMPPQGGPAPGGAPPQADPSAATPDQGQGDGGGIQKLLMNVDQAIDHLQMVIGQSKAASPEEKQMISQVDQIYGKLMDSLGVGGSAAGQDSDDQGSPGSQGQTVPPEAGGNKGAIPAM